MNEEDLKQAYKILELPEDSPKDVVEKRYFLMLKKSRTGQALDLQAINQAYKIISKFDLERNTLKYEEEHYGDSKSRKFLDNFWSRYKVHVWVSIILVVVIVALLNTYMDKREERIALSKLPPSNLDILFVGEFYSEDSAKIGDALLPLFPEWQRIKTEVSYAPQNPKDQFDIASVQKNVITLMSEIPDIYILDKHNFNMLVRQSAFQSLDTEASEIPPVLLLRAQTEDNPATHIYGIDLSNSPALVELGIASKENEIIAALRFDTENPENALEFIRTLLNRE